MDPNDARLYTIFSSPDSNAFQNAKASLNQHNIKFFASGEFKNDNSPFEIQVFGRDKGKAESLVRAFGGRALDPSQTPKVNKTIAGVVVAIVAMIIMFVAGLLVFLLAV